jgi:prepilin-type N-terminal cleavage/methylation domain-containing protein
MVGNAKRMRNPSMPRGFTLLEMFVVVAIIAIILSVILVNQSSFNRNNLLTDTAYSVALSVRQTQSIGLSGRAINTTSKNTGYGIHVETAGASPITTYTQFADIYPDVVTISLMPGSQLPTGLNQIGTVCTGHTVLTPSSPEARPGDCLYYWRFLRISG